GGKQPRPDLLDGQKVSGSGSLMIGDKGKMYTPGDYGGSYQLLGGATEVKVEYVRSPGHFEEYVRAIKGGPPGLSNFPEYAGPLTETVLLGNLAVLAGTRVVWDAKTLTARAPAAPEPSLD